MKWRSPECKRPHFLARQTMRLQESLTEEGKGAGGGPNRFARERDPQAVEAIALLLLKCDVGREGMEGGVYTVKFKARAALLRERNERSWQQAMQGRRRGLCLCGWGVGGSG